MNIFQEKNIKPMLLSETHNPFDSEEYLFELKLDGIRSIIYIDKTGVEIRNKRNVYMNATYPELTGIYKQIKKRCILDGEIFCMKDGKPDFPSVQKRSLMTNSIKIQIIMNKHPVSFSAFDILYAGNEQVTNRPLMERKAILQDIATEDDRFSITRYIPDKGIALYNLTVRHGLEGVVAKRKDSRYYIGKTTKEWIKIKNLKDDDFVICGYSIKDKGIGSLILGAYDNGRLVYQSHVALGIPGSVLEKVQRVGRTENPFSNIPDENVIWIKPILVCTVRYMMRTDSGGLRQPVFKGLRDDKDPHDCIV